MCVCVRACVAARLRRKLVFDARDCMCTAYHACDGDVKEMRCTRKENPFCGCSAFICGARFFVNAVGSIEVLVCWCNSLISNRLLNKRVHFLIYWDLLLVDSLHTLQISQRLLITHASPFRVVNGVPIDWSSLLHTWILNPPRAV